MASISSTGIGSGLDVNSIVSQLVALEKQPLKSLEAKATTVNAQVSALGGIKSQFATLTEVATRLSTSSGWAARTASSSNTTAATISVTGEAAATSFTLDVDALAQRQSVSSMAIPTGSFVGAGTMTIRLGTWSGNISTNAGADNTAQAAADAASPAIAAAQAALLTAQTDLADANTALGDRNTELTNANAALLSAQGTLDAKNLALTTANSDLAPFTSALASANLVLAGADDALLAATNIKVAADLASTAADLASTNADAASVVATAAVGLATADSVNADAALNGAFSDDNAAASALAAFAAGTHAAKGYSDAYTAWVGAVASNDHVTPSLQAAENAALSARNIAYTAFGLMAGAASTAANLSRDNALASDSAAAGVLATFAGAGPSALKDYSDAYSAWTSAVAANDHVTPVLQTAQDNALVAKGIAYTALGQELVAAQSDSSAANVARDNALAADNTAAQNLFTLAGAGPSATKDYANAYLAWSSAVVANDHATPALQTIENDALAARSVAYTAMSPAERSAADAMTAAADVTDASALKGAAVTAASAVTTAQTNLSSANAITASADATDASALAAAAATAAGVVAAADALTLTASGTDASALKTAAVAAEAAKAAAIATAATATNAAATALINKSDAAAAVVTATNALVAPTAAQASAAAEVLAATNNLVAPTAAQALAAGEVLTATGLRDTAQGDVATATTARNTAQSLVSTTTSAVAAASANVTSATALRPTFTAASGSADFTITASATDTVAKLVIKINAANAGVVATKFFDGTQDRLQLTATNSGAAAGFRVEVNDTGDGVSTDNNNLSRMAYDPGTSAYGMASSGIPATYGSDARARINGLAVTSKTNTLTDSLTGVTIDLKAVTTSSAMVSVSEDVTLSVKNVNDFVTAYNTLNKTLADLTKYDAATKKGSLFQADSSIVGLQRVLRNMLGSISAGSSYTRLSDVGLDRQLDGSLKVNAGKLDTASRNGTEMHTLFTKNNSNKDTNGFALKFAAFGVGLIGSDGAVANKETALQAALTRNSKDQTKLNERAIATEARLRKTYSALDAKMASLNALNSYVAQQVTSWNKSTG
jgi:flagellar hook-associated protein 2